MKLEDALRIWRSDKGYRKINSFLVGTDKDYPYHPKNNQTMKLDGVRHDIEDAIATLKRHMKPSPTEITYYRGGSSNSKKSFIKKSFISVSTSKEQAESFVDQPVGGVLYKIIVDPNVKRIDVGIEDEVLLEDNLFWEYLGMQNGEGIVRIQKAPPTMTAAPKSPKSPKAPKSPKSPKSPKAPKSPKSSKSPKSPKSPKAPKSPMATSAELSKYYQDMKEDNALLDLEEDITPSEFIEYVKFTTNGRIIISHDKASEIIEHNRMNGGNKTPRKTRKTRKPRKTRKTRKTRKNNCIRCP
jgi:hypothetical protein